MFLLNVFFEKYHLLFFMKFNHTFEKFVALSRNATLRVNAKVTFSWQLWLISHFSIHSLVQHVLIEFLGNICHSTFVQCVLYFWHCIMCCEYRNEWEILFALKELVFIWCELLFIVSVWGLKKRSRAECKMEDT